MIPQRFELNTIYSVPSHLTEPCSYHPGFREDEFVRESSYFLWNGDYVNDALEMFLLPSLADGVILSGVEM